MCQRVYNTVNTVLYCNYRCVVDLVTSRGKKNNANITKYQKTLDRYQSAGLDLHLSQII